MNLEGVVDFFIKQYEDAVRTRESIRNRAVLLFSILQLIWPMCVFFLNHILSNKSDFPIEVYTISLELVLALGIGGLVSSIFLWKSITFKAYPLAPLSDDVYSHYQRIREKWEGNTSEEDLKEHNLKSMFKSKDNGDNNDGSQVDEKVYSEFGTYLCKTFSNGATEYQKTNEDAMKEMEKGVIALNITLWIAGVNFLIYMISQIIIEG